MGGTAPFIRWAYGGNVLKKIYTTINTLQNFRLNQFTISTEILTRSYTNAQLKPDAESIETGKCTDALGIDTEREKIMVQMFVTFYEGN